MNEEILKKLGYNNIATQILLKRSAAEIDTEILMPGEYEPDNNNAPDDQAVEIILENLKTQFTTLINTIKSLPDEHAGDDYFGTLKKNLLHVSFDVGLKINSLMTQAGMSNDGFEEFINKM
jgi:hypothetical protein